MTWLNLWALPLLILPLLAFLYRRRIKQEFSAPSLLYFRDLAPKRILPTMQLAARKERVIYGVLLLLAVIIMLDPVIRGRAERTLIVVDNSASMGASMGAKSESKRRWERAINEAKTRASSAISAGEAVAVISLLNRTSAPQYVRKQEEISQQISALRLLNWGARLERRLPEIFALKKRDEVGELVVLTDRSLAEQDDDVVEQLRWVNVAEEVPIAANVAITAVHQPRHLHDYPYRTEISLRNFGNTLVQGVFLQRVDTQQPRPITGAIDLLPGEQKVVEVPQYVLGTVLEPIPIQLGFKDSDAVRAQDTLQSDNQIWVLPDERKPMRVMLLVCTEQVGKLWARVFPHPGIELTAVAVNKPIPSGKWDVVIADACSDKAWQRLQKISAKKGSELTLGHRILLKPSATGKPVGVAAQATPHNNPVLTDVKRLLGMVMHNSQTLALPTGNDVTEVTALLGGLKSMAKDQVYAYSSVRQRKAKDGAAKPETSSPEKSLVLGFDIHGVCDSSEEGRDTYVQDDCLSLSFMLLNSLAWMDDRLTRPPQYLPTGLVFARYQVNEASLRDRDNQRMPALGGKTQWLLEKDGAWRYTSDADSYWLSAALLDTHESSLPSNPVNLDKRDVDILNAYQDRPLWPTLYKVLCGLLLLEALLLLWFWSQRRRRQ